MFGEAEHMTPKGGMNPMSKPDPILNAINMAQKLLEFAASQAKNNLSANDEHRLTFDGQEYQLYPHGWDEVWESSYGTNWESSYYDSDSWSC